MNPHRSKPSSSWLFFVPVCSLIFTPLAAQVASPAPALSPADAKYDLNKNGRLDADELTAQQAKEGRVRPQNSGEFASDDAVELSPFEVKEDNRGYYAMNTMSGTRLNSKVEDLGSSISVVTKEQMSDFAMLDINDIFMYEAGTEGAATYTDFAFDQSSQPQDNLAASPTTANRVRGLNSANIAFGGFETSRRAPIDPTMLDSVEISRGPNSTLFGLGNASGTVNSVPASANLRRNRTRLQFRSEVFGDKIDDAGYRASLDINQVLFRDKLAVRFSTVQQNTEYNLQPSGVKAERYNGMIKYRPFKNTTISASYHYFHQHGRRPNSITPRDAITPWKAAGSPTWDPVTTTAYINGSPVDRTGKPTAALGAGNPTINGAPVFNSGYQTTGRGTSLMFIDTSGVSFWTAPRGTTTQDALLTTSASNNQAGFNYMFLNPRTLRATQPLWSSDGAVSDKSVYDWSEINIAAMNQVDEVVKTSLVSVDQVFINQQNQNLTAQVAWFREDSPKYWRDFPTGSSGVTTLMLDPNMRRLDGSPNPNYLRPMIGISEVNLTNRPLSNDTYRAQLAYQLDLRNKKGWMRWLGAHSLAGFGEYKRNELRSYSYQLAMTDDHAWLTAGTPRANVSRIPGSTSVQDGASPTGARSYRFYYVGDDQGTNVDYAPYIGELQGVYPYTWGNFAAKQSVTESARLGLAASGGGTAGANNSLKIQKTQGVALQSHLLKDHLVTTFGWRKDKVYTRQGVQPRLLADGYSHDVAWDEQWASGDYSFSEGVTRTAGAVAKITRWLNVHANKSDSFVLADQAINLHGQLLPNPRGKGEDYGFTLKLFSNRLVLRANQFTTRTEGDRSGNSTTLAGRAVKMDVFDGQMARNFSLDTRARQWLQATQPGLSGAALDAAVAKEIGMDPELLATLQDSVNFGGLPIAQGQDALSKGKEFEINYNPMPFWTMRANVTETETIQAAIAQDLLDYLSERGKVWETIVDKQTGQLWYTSSYEGQQTAQRYMPGNVTTPLGIAQQTVGKSLPQVRRYKASFSTKLDLRGITDHRFWSKFNIGGAVRWEDKGAIGYYGVQSLPDIITELDKNNPIYDKDHTYVDLFGGYRSKLNKGKIAMSIQLNVRNIAEGGRLQPISAFPSGQPNAYRIVAPRQFILTVGFDM